jgi:hypothetical protein
MSKTHSILIVAVLGAGALLLFRQAGNSRRQQALASGLQPGPIRNTTLPNALVERIRRLKSVFAEVYPRSHAEWLDGFQRDAVPEREVAIWEAMGAAYTSFTRERSLSLDAKREVLGLLLVRSAADEQSTLANAKLRHLTRDDAQQLLRLYSTAPHPVQIQKQ